MDPYDRWARECDKAGKSPLDVPFEDRAQECIEAAAYLRALAFGLAGVGCAKCGGEGQRAYPSTATWHGGVGGQAITRGVCDVCWGTGRTDETGYDQRMATIVQSPSPTTFCAEERAEGKGGCGACAICCAELQQIIDDMRAGSPAPATRAAGDASGASLVTTDVERLEPSPDESARSEEDGDRACSVCGADEWLTKGMVSVCLSCQISTARKDAIVEILGEWKSWSPGMMPDHHSIEMTRYLLAMLKPMDD